MYQIQLNNFWFSLGVIYKTQLHEHYITDFNICNDSIEKNSRHESFKPVLVSALYLKNVTMKYLINIISTLTSLLNIKCWSSTGHYPTISIS